jgi:hypothetical protein
MPVRPSEADRRKPQKPVRAEDLPF